MPSTDLKAYMADNPGAVIEDVARECKVTPRAVIEALPPSMMRIGGGERCRRDAGHRGMGRGHADRPHR